MRVRDMSDANKWVGQGIRLSRMAAMIRSIPYLYDRRSLPVLPSPHFGDELS